MLLVLLILNAAVAVAAVVGLAVIAVTAVVVGGHKNLLLLSCFLIRKLTANVPLQTKKQQQ